MHQPMKSMSQGLLMSSKLQVDTVDWSVVASAGMWFV